MNEIFAQQMEENRKAYEKLRDEICREYAGKYVAMAFGRIVCVSPDFDEAMDAVKDLSPSPEHVLVFPAEEGPIFDIIDSPYRELLE
jgi:Family of unknown function (DUF5678)